MEYRKEKNLLIVASEDGTIKGQYDWTTSTYYGVKGTPIKTMPKAFGDTIGKEIINSHRWIISHTTDETLTFALNRWEQLASLGLYAEDTYYLTDKHYEFPALKKDFVNYLKTNCQNRFNNFNYKNYELQKQVPEYERLSVNNKLIVSDILSRSIGLKLAIWYVRALFRLQLEDYEYLNRYTYVPTQNLLQNYLKTCDSMNQEPVITKNFLITICHTLHVYENYRIENIDKLIKQHNDIPELYYENDTYIVRPLLSKEEFHAEATAQHNCVERLYMEPVVDKKTHIVVIRKKNDPDTSLITCEINNDFNIIQYLGVYNSRPKASEQEFREELSNYLSSLSRK